MNLSRKIAENRERIALARSNLPPIIETGAKCGEWIFDADGFKILFFNFIVHIAEKSSQQCFDQLEDKNLRRIDEA